jgi:outer membrane receptor protein involved in Fe transport
MTTRIRNIDGSPSPWFYGESDVIHQFNFNSGFNVNSRLQLRAFVSNLLNDRGWTGPNNIEVQNYAGRVTPRTYGVAFSIKFAER